jgi:hypothetical protein
MQLSEGRAAEIDDTLLCTTNGTHLSSVASLQLHVRLLYAVRPVNFPTFRSFQRWQQTALATLSTTLIWSVTQYRQVILHAASFLSGKNTPR